MIICKIVPGWVTQLYASNQKQFIGQFFTADDDLVEFINMDGEKINEELKDEITNLEFKMVQPEQPARTTRRRKIQE